jgi:hypothetical protein
MRRVLHLAATAMVAAALLLAGATVASAHSGDGPVPNVDIAAVRAATAEFQNVAVAKSAQYDELKDAAGIACIDNPKGGMGIHYVNLALATDAVIHPTTPEVLVYEPDKEGRLKLVAVEYVVFEAALGGAEPPELFGHEMHRMPGPGEAEPQNRFGLPAFYELHLWAWEHNPAGMFDDWNPKVAC